MIGFLHELGVHPGEVGIELCEQRHSGTLVLLAQLGPAAVNELLAAIHSLGDVAPSAVYSEHRSSSDDR